MVLKTLKEFLLEKIKYCGQDVTVRHLNTRELINYSFVVSNNERTKLTVADSWYVEKKLRDYKHKIKRILELLISDRNSRQAVIDFDINSSLPNCLISIQFLIRHKQLYCIATSRSLDVKNKLDVDIEICREISKQLEEIFDVKLEYIKFNVASLHYYHDKIN